MKLGFYYLCLVEWKNLIAERGRWLEALWLNGLLLLVVGLSGVESLSMTSILVLYWVMLLTLYLLLMSMSYRHDLAVGRLDQLRLMASPYTLVWAKMLTAMTLLLFVSIVLVFAFSLLLGFILWQSLLIFSIAMIPGMIALSHYIDLMLLAKSNNGLLVGLMWLPNALPYVVLSYLYILSSNPKALVIAIALSFFWLASLPWLQARLLRLRHHEFG